MADDDQRVRIARQMLLQPERAFEVEIVGRLVEQQQVGLGEQRGGERHPHPPAAGEFAAGALADRPRKTRGPARIAAARAGAACAPMSASRVWISAIRWGSCAVSASASSRARSASACSTTSIRAVGAVRRLLRQPADAPARRNLHAALFGGDVAGHHAEQRGLAAAVAADQSDAGTVRNADRGAVKQQPSGNANRQVVDDEHAAIWPSAAVEAIPAIGTVA